MERLICPVCGKQHDELPAFTFKGPSFWAAADEATRERDFQFNGDLVQYKDEHFMLLGQLPIPISDRPGQHLVIVAWAATKRPDWERYRDTHYDPDTTELEPFLGRLANTIPGYPESQNLELGIKPQGNRRRPVLVLLTKAEHELIRAQQEGITLDQAMRWLHAVGGF